MIILGIHDGHNASASLIVDGKLVCALGEERLSRDKQDSTVIFVDKGWFSKNTHISKETGIIVVQL